MLRRLIIVSAALAAFTAPALAAGWNVIKETGSPSLSAISSCIVVDRAAIGGEEQVAGPYGTQQEGLNARHRYPACDVSSMASRS